MSNIVDMPPRVDRIEQATAWISKLDRGLSSAEEAEFVQWLTVDKANKQALITAASVWDRMESLSRLGDLFPEPEANRRVTPVFKVMGVAASLLLAVLLLAQYVGISNPATQQVSKLDTANIAGDQVYETAVGEQSSIVLSDGSVLSLNTNTRIEEQYNELERALYLRRGEMHIKVAHQAKRPLKVYVGDRVVQAVGTEFSVEVTQSQDIEVIVTEGKVWVSLSEPSDQQPPAEMLAATESVARTTVSAGEHIILAEELAQAETIEPEDIEVKLSWRGGNLVFTGESLEEAITEIERYTQVEFIILDDELKKVRVAGLFKAGDVEGLLKTLRDNFDVSYERVAGDKILLSQRW